MSLVSPFLKYVIYPALAKTGCLRRIADPKPVVLTYHGILPAGYRVIDPLLDGALVSAERFRDQLRMLKANYEVISPSDLVSWLSGNGNLPLRAALLTCDDGLVNNLTDMLPILKEQGVHCLFFATGASAAEEARMLWYEALYLMLLDSAAKHIEIDNLGGELSNRQQKRTFWWKLVQRLSARCAENRSKLLQSAQEQLGLPRDWESNYRDNPEHYRRFYMLTADGLRQLARSDMAIGSHTLTHPVLSQLPEDEAWREMTENQRVLERALSRDVWAFAYPFGDPVSVTSREQELARRTNYKCAFLNYGGRLQPDTPHFVLPRVHITGDMTISEFEAHVAGVHHRLKNSWSLKGNVA